MGRTAIVSAALGCTLALCGGAPGLATARERTPACAPAQGKRTYAYARLPGVPVALTSLDLYRPSACRPAQRRLPVVIWVHGGGYRTGDKGNGAQRKATLFTRRGMLFVSANYRLTRPGRPGSARWPAHFRDVAGAVAWVRARIARLGGDPARIALLGHSAGADIVSNVTVDPRWLRERRLSLRAVRCAGPLDTEGFDKTRASARTRAQWTAALGNAPDYLRSTSATLIARRGTGIPRTITVVRGTPRRTAVQLGFASRLRSLGVPVTTIAAGGLTHAQVNSRIGAPGDRVMTPPLLRFLNRCFGR